jgi:hypothetical protein
MPKELVENPNGGDHEACLDPYLDHLYRDVSWMVPQLS